MCTLIIDAGRRGTGYYWCGQCVAGSEISSVAISHAGPKAAKRSFSLGPGIYSHTSLARVMLDAMWRGPVY
jgi:hypothetical protein